MKINLIQRLEHFFKDKRKDILLKSSKKLRKVSSEFESFLQEDKYLTFKEKDHFLNQISEKEDLIKIPWYFFLDKKLKKEIIENSRKLEKYKVIIEDFNEKFIKEKINDYSSLFKNLDNNQKEAIVKDDIHNLVVAGAGSGKTETLITRIAYLVKRKSDSIKPERILALAFQNKASKEMEERLNHNFGLNVQIKTFHSLGLKILEEESKINSTKPPKLKFSGENCEAKMAIYIKEIFSKSEAYLQNKIINFMKDFNEEETEKEVIDFKTKEEYYNYKKNQKYVALDGTKVKSYAEREILNFFITHDLNNKRIKIIYEKPAEWMSYQSKDGSERIPNPDFFFPDLDLYYEHWGLNKEGKCPDWINEEEYLKSMKLKLLKFKEQEKYSLVESWSWEANREDFQEIIKERFLNKLKEKYPQKEFIISSVNYRSLVERVWSDCKDSVRALSQNIMNFILVAKTNNYSVSELKNKIENGIWTKKQKAFADLALEIFEIYQKDLEKNNEIDFADMINLAIIKLKENPLLYKNKFDHILIDEYQDISPQRYELIKELINKNQACKLFCVGDDWQSIMGFTGSNLKYFTHFKEYFERPERTNLETNYRSEKKIVELGKKIIEKNGNVQLLKKTEANSKKEGVINFYASEIKNDSTDDAINYYTQVSESCMKEILKLKEEGYEWEDILILRRINPQNAPMTRILYETAKKYGVPILEENYNPKAVSILTIHKSKGLQAKAVFILGVDKGIYGFPNELQSPDILIPACRNKEEKKEEEERRLFYVAVTRAKERLYIYYQKCCKSKFLEEINPKINPKIIK